MREKTGGILISRTSLSSGHSIGAPGLESDIAGCKSCPCHTLTVWLWASFSPSLSFSLPKCTRIVVGVKWESNRTGGTHSTHVFPFSGTWPVSEPKCSYNDVICVEQSHIYCSFRHSLGGVLWAKPDGIWVDKWISEATPESSTGEERPVVTRNPACGQHLDCGEQGSSSWWILAANCPPHKLVPICQPVVGGGQPSLMLLFARVLIFLSKCSTDSFQEKKRRTSNTKEPKEETIEYP